MAQFLLTEFLGLPTSSSIISDISSTILQILVPIFYYGISTKTSEKDLKIPNLQALTLGRIIKITLYFLNEQQLIKNLILVNSKLPA